MIHKGGMERWLSGALAILLKAPGSITSNLITVHDHFPEIWHLHTRAHKKNNKVKSVFSKDLKKKKIRKGIFPDYKSSKPKWNLAG